MSSSVKQHGFLLKLYFLYRDIGFLLRRTYRAILKWDVRIAAISWLRFFWLVKVLGKVRFFDGAVSGVAEATIGHNYKGLSLFSIKAFSGARPARLFDILDGIESIDKKNHRVLVIGPRAESEFYIASARGFNKEQMRGLDLISYSPYVDLGDMHDMPYEDHSFDVVVLGWVLAYSNDLSRACKEIVRVSKHGAIVIAGTEYNPKSISQVEGKLGYVPGASERIKSNKQVLGHFGDFVGKVIYDHDVSADVPDKKSGLIFCIQVDK